MGIAFSTSVQTASLTRHTQQSSLQYYTDLNKKLYANELDDANDPDDASDLDVVVAFGADTVVLPANQVERLR